MTDIVERIGKLNDALLACGSDYSDILLDAVNELKQLRQQLATCNERYKEHHGFDWNMLEISHESQRDLMRLLAECQAREKASHGSNYEKGVFNPVFDTEEKL